MRILKEETTYEVVETKRADAFSTGKTLEAAAKKLQADIVVVGNVSQGLNLSLRIRGTDGKTRRIIIPGGTHNKLKRNITNGLSASIDLTGSDPVIPPAPAAAPPEAPAAVPIAEPLAEPPTEETASSSSRDDLLLGTETVEPPKTVTASDPLTIGGMIYLRSQISAERGQRPGDFTLSAPSLAEAFFDSRPNDRVRGMILGRMRYDPTRGSRNSDGSSTTASPTLLLDQLWLRFDIERTVFFTVGKQHTRWGIGRFWQPTDFLHPARRDPIAVFDERPGATMLKLHLPWESQGWNLYGVAMFERSDGLVDELGDIGGAARGEIVLGSTEIGVDFLAQRGSSVRVGADFSAGVGPFDVYVDAAFRSASDITIWHPVAEIDQAAPRRDQYEPRSAQGYAGITTEVVTGLTWDIRYNDNDVLTLGGEYFYNGSGYTDKNLYPWLLVGPYLNPNEFGGPAFHPFYVGRHYAAVFAALPAPFAWDNSMFTISTLGNLSDKSYVSRLDYSHTLLTHLQLEAFGALYYGQRGGEFQLDINMPSRCPDPVPDCVDAAKLPALRLRPLLFSLGLALKIKI